METDIIIQGFKEAESKYGLRYTTFIGDGDCSIHPNLITGVPGWGHIVKKSVCKSCNEMLLSITRKAGE